jgi:glycerophosphoryl diester phosphodiesterase
MNRVFVAALIVSIAGCSAARTFDLQGHRGARGLAPENTLAAFERALGLGVTTFERDTNVTKDGGGVITHDPTLNPAITRDAEGRWHPTYPPCASWCSRSASTTSRAACGRPV